MRDNIDGMQNYGGTFEEQPGAPRLGFEDERLRSRLENNEKEGDSAV